MFNPLNAQLNPICHLLALLGAHHIFHVSRLRVNSTAASIEKAKISKRQNSRTLHTFIKKIHYLIFSQQWMEPSCHIKYRSMYQYLFSLVLYVTH